MSTETTIDTDWGWPVACVFSTLVEPVSRLTEFGFRLMTPVEPGLFDNCTTVFWERVYRGTVATAIVGGAALTLWLVPGGLLLPGALGYGFLLLTTRLGAYYLQSGKGFTYVKGNAAEKALPADQKFSVLSWNVCGIWGGISRSNGGVVEWRKRFDGILREIRSQDPDVLVLSEIYDTALAEKLVASLKDRYAHFYTTMGPNIRGSVGGLFVATKFPVHNFTHTSFTNNSWDLNRGFATLEVGPKGAPFAAVIGTHLIHGNAEEKRCEQVAQMVDTVARKALPTFVAGDLNQTPDEFARSTGQHVYQKPPEGTFTCTDAFIRDGWNPNNITPDEYLDYIAQVKNEAPEVKMKVQQLGLLHGENTRTALSDHDALSARITLVPVQA